MQQLTVLLSTPSLTMSLCAASPLYPAPPHTTPNACCRSLPQFKDGSFDAILDKGTLDSLMCGQHAGEDSMRMLQEAHRSVSQSVSTSRQASLVSKQHMGGRSRYRVLL